jgi:hypothetical protein
MALKIAVRKNHFPNSLSPFVVRSASSDVVEYDKLIEIMAKGRTTISQIDIIAVMQLYKEELQKQLAEGKTVKTPTGSFFLCAAGSLDSPGESYLPKDRTNNHEIRLHHRPEKRFENLILDELETVREERPDLSVPSLRSVAAACEEDSGTIRSGGLVRIKGLRLRFDPKESGQGVFFADSAGIESRSTLYPLILPGTVIAGVPSILAAGSYAIVLRAAVNGKDVREARFEGLTISAFKESPASITVAGYK